MSLTLHEWEHNRMTLEALREQPQKGTIAMSSTIREYLSTTRENEGDRGWTSCWPVTTHPEILQAVRGALDGGLFYNDDVERYVEERAGDMPEHRPHGHPERDPLTYQLGREVYLAKGIIGDEQRQAQADEYAADGYVPLDADALKHGDRYLVRFGTVYVGNTEPVYGDDHEVRVSRVGERIVLLPKGARSRGFAARTPALVKPL